ncbi:hypothetical protein VTK26DRAFT_9383 [Humicola hyalothermophila]
MKRHIEREMPTILGATLIDLNYTTYEGLRLSNGVSAFLGMRYAAPPLGDLRWRAPVEPAWTGATEEANTYPPICLGIDVGYPPAGQDEDCLFVNVWAPSNATVRSKLPVWLFIQGGGYVANTNANWDGNEVVEKSGHAIVMVHFNYRVGLWGFLASERVRADGDLNVGLLDQRMLMKWVKTHIASFGGDPDRIVIHGASAGAGSVAMHLVAYGGRNDGLFVGAIAESVFLPAQPFVSELEYQFDRVISQTNCATMAPDQQMACLRSKDVALLQTANHAQPFPGRSEPPVPLFYWTPCVDGDLLRDLPYRLFESGRFIRVPMLFGTASDEGSVFAANAATKQDVATFFVNNYPHLTLNDTDSILFMYPKLPPLPNHNEWFPTASQAYGEATFICPQTNILNLIHSHYFDYPSQPRASPNTTTITQSTVPSPQQPVVASPPPPVFAYRYDVHSNYTTSLGLGVPHLFDAPAIFGPDNVRGTGPPASYRSYNAPVVPLMMGWYTSFVRALDPNTYRHRSSVSLPPSPEGADDGGGGVPIWTPWGAVDDGNSDEEEEEEGEDRCQRMVVETGGGARLERVGVEELERCRFWLGLGKGVMRQR